MDLALRMRFAIQHLHVNSKKVKEPDTFFFGGEGLVL